ncbi:MAG: YihY/virulence factor BrkB family protein [Gemmatimonadaceae bacterium]
MTQQRPWWISLGWTAREYIKRVWDHSSENNLLFLAGGIAFNILLAAVPFVLLLVTGVTYLLPAITRVDSTVAIYQFIDRLLPGQTSVTDNWVHTMLDDIMQSRGTVTLYSALIFTWLSTRLFGSLRSALADVFDIEHERGIIQGKIYDIQITVVSTVLFVASTFVSTYLALATTRGLSALQDLGLRRDVMTGLEYWIGRGLAFAFIALMFFALYKYLPIRKVRTRTAWLAAGFSAVLLEVAKQVFRVVLMSITPQSIYTGTLAALVIVVVWTYYAALIFLIGGEVGQVYELRRTRKLQREVFT